MTVIEKIKAAQDAAADARANGRPIGHDRPDVIEQAAGHNETEGRRRWAEMIARSYIPVTDPAAEVEWLSHRADGFEGCSCSSHWVDHMQADPPDTSSPLAYTAWVERAKAAVAKRLGKKPDRRIIHALSGGIDSASVLYQLLSAGEKVILYHIEWPTRRAAAERRAVNQIIAWCVQRFGVMLPARFKPARVLDNVADIEAVGFVAGSVLREFPRIYRVSASTSADDAAQSGWSVRNAQRQAVTQIMAGRAIEWVRPNVEKTRAQVIADMPDDLLALCSYCRNPQNGDTCGDCHACRRTQTPNDS